MREKLLKFINRCLRTQKPDLHSFVIEIECGKAFVSCLCGEVAITSFVYDVDGHEIREQFNGSASEAADYLIRNGAKWETIEQ